MSTQLYKKEIATFLRASETHFWKYQHRTNEIRAIFQHYDDDGVGLKPLRENSFKILREMLDAGKGWRIGTVGAIVKGRVPLYYALGVKKKRTPVQWAGFREVDLGTITRGNQLPLYWYPEDAILVEREIVLKKGQKVLMSQITFQDEAPLSPVHEMKRKENKTDEIKARKTEGKIQIFSAKGFTNTKIVRIFGPNPVKRKHSTGARMARGKPARKTEVRRKTALSPPTVPGGRSAAGKRATTSSKPTRIARENDKPVRGVPSQKSRGIPNIQQAPSSKFVIGSRTNSTKIPHRLSRKEVRMVKEALKGTTNSTKMSKRISKVVKSGDGWSLVIQGINYGVDWWINRREQKKVQKALSEKESEIAKIQKDDPTMGVLVLIHFTYNIGNKDALIEATPVFDNKINVYPGRTRDEALRRETVSRAPSQHKKMIQEFWIEPIERPNELNLDTPFPKASDKLFTFDYQLLWKKGLLQNVLYKLNSQTVDWIIAECLDTSGYYKTKFQKVEWMGVRDFVDDWGENTLEVSRKSELKFYVLLPPEKITYYNGTANVAKTSIEIVDKKTASGEHVKGLDLGGEDAIMIFPADSYTLKGFNLVRRTQDNLNQLRYYVNIRYMRWARPLRITKYVPIYERVENYIRAHNNRLLRKFSDKNYELSSAPKKIKHGVIYNFRFRQQKAQAANSQKNPPALFYTGQYLNYDHSKLKRVDKENIIQWARSKRLEGISMKGVTTIVKIGREFTGDESARNFWRKYLNSVGPAWWLIN